MHRKHVLGHVLDFIQFIVVQPGQVYRLRLLARQPLAVFPRIVRHQRVMRVERNKKRVRRHAQDARAFLEVDVIHVQPRHVRPHAVVQHGHQPVGLEHLLDQLPLVGAQVEAVRRRRRQKRLFAGHLVRALRVGRFRLAARHVIG